MQSGIISSATATFAANRAVGAVKFDVHLKDDHLQYAITWFTLAGALLIAFGVWARTRRLA